MILPSSRSAASILLGLSLALSACDDSTPGTGGAGSTSASSTTGKGSSTTTSSAQSTTATSTTNAASSSSTGGGNGRSIAITNHGFEADLVADGTYNDKITPQGWTLIDPTSIIGLDYNSRGVLNPTGTPLYVGGAPEGKNVALIFLWRAQTNGIEVGLGQETAETIEAYTEYTLRVRVGNINGEPNVPYDLDGFPGYRVELRAGATVLASDTSLAPADGMFQESVIVHTIGPNDPAIGQKLGVALFNLNKADSGIEVNFDDVRIDAVPIF